MEPTILIVDDVLENIYMFSSQLKNTYNILIAKSEEEALKTAQITPPDLIIINTITNKIDGFDICNKFKSDYELGEIPIILIVKQKQSSFLNNSFSTGIVDFIQQPVDITLLMYRIKIHIDYKEVISYLKNQRSSLVNIMNDKAAQNSEIIDIPVLAMKSFALTKDYSNGKHVMRTQLYVEELSRKLQKNPKYSKYLTDERISLIVKSAPLHDVGKVGIPSSIIMKPGPLTNEEFNVMKTHTDIGLKIIMFFEENIPQLIQFMELAKEIVYSHHERWNGEGYPQGLKEDEIPISARIVSVADVYDALVSDRVYKKAFTHDTAVKIIKDESGKQFDPDLVEAFLSLEKTFKSISDKHKNE